MKHQLWIIFIIMTCLSSTGFSHRMYQDPNSKSRYILADDDSDEYLNTVINFETGEVTHNSDIVTTDNKAIPQISFKEAFQKLSSLGFALIGENFEPSWEIRIQNQDQLIISYLPNNHDFIKSPHAPIKINTYFKDLDQSGDNYILMFQAEDNPEIFGVITSAELYGESDFSSCQISQSSTTYNIVFHYDHYISTGCAAWQKSNFD